MTSYLEIACLAKVLVKAVCTYHEVGHDAVQGAIMRFYLTNPLLAVVLSSSGTLS